MADPKGSVDPSVSRRLALDCTAFPCTIPSISFALNDLGCQQHILSNRQNFAENTACDIVEIEKDGTANWSRNLNDTDLKRYVETSSQSNENLISRVLFLTLERRENATFGCQLSLSQQSSQIVLNGFQVRPEFTPLMLGQFVGNHLPPAHFATFDEQGGLLRLDFICQQPRWGFRVRQWPVSTWMNFEEQTGVVTCIITSEAGDKRTEALQTRLTSAFPASGPTLAAGTSNATDPFFIPSLISHECFMQSDSGVFDLGLRLYSALDLVDAAAEGSYDRDKVKALTFKLHQISQDADALIQSADIGITLVQSMRLTQERLAYWSRSQAKHQLQQSIHTAEYLAKAIEARKRWLLGAKSRKDTTMSLVYNLVSQKEAETNIGIARDTKNDSASMKAIAALTMVFLPASAVSSFFGMSFFDGRAGSFTVAPEWWIFLAVTVPLTAVVMIAWRLWETFGIRMPQVPLAVFGQSKGPFRKRSIWRTQKPGCVKEEGILEHV